MTEPGNIREKHKAESPNLKDRRGLPSPLFQRLSIFYFSDQQELEAPLPIPIPSRFPSPGWGCRKSPQFTTIVIPAEAGIHSSRGLMDPRFRGGDGREDFPDSLGWERAEGEGDKTSSFPLPQYRGRGRG